MKARVPLVLLAAALLSPTLGPGAARAEDDDLEIRLYRVGSLTWGKPMFIRPVMGCPGPGTVSDEENPLFGAEGEEPILPLGTADELIELLQMNVEPVFWEITEGADISTSGESTLVVRATPAVHGRVAEYLRGLESAVLTPVAVEIRTVRTAEGQALPAGLAEGTGTYTDEEVAGILEGGQAGPSVSITALVSQQAVAYRGTQRAFVQDYDVQVAQTSKISDPIVGVANLGLAAQTTVSIGDRPDAMALEVQAVLARWQSEVVREIPVVGAVEMPAFEIVSVHEFLVVRPGLWHAVDGRSEGDGARWTFLVRVRPAPHVGSAASEPLVFRAVAADTGPIVGRTFDVADLHVVPWNVVGPSPNLVPSNFTPPEPPELPEPGPIFPEEAVVDLLRGCVAERSWNREGAFIEVRYGRLFARNTARALDAIAERLDGLRREYLKSVVCDVEVWDVSRATALAWRALGAGGSGSVLLDPARREAAPAAGDVTLLDRACVRSLKEARNYVFVGREVTYLQDYEVEVAQESAIPNPVVQSVPTGLVLDVQPSLLTTGDAVNVCVRVARAEIVEMRPVETPHGIIDAPEMDLLRLQTNVVIPFGRTAIVGSGGTGERERVVLLTPRLVPYVR